MTKKHNTIKTIGATPLLNQTVNQKQKTRYQNSLGIIIADFAFLIYAQGISNEYTADDHFVTDKNDLIQKGFAAIPTILSTDYLYGFEKGMLSGPVYRPASLIMFDLEWNLFPENPHIFHFMNVLLFAITCWILFLLLCRLFEEKFSSFGLLFPFVCALLYAAHPIHTEVVDNIKSRDEILCFLFGVLAIFALIKAISKETLLYFIPGCVCFFISLLSKETAITFLVIIPLTTYVFTDVSARKLVIISVAVLLTASIYFIIREYVLHSIRLNTSDTYLYDTVVAAPNFISRQATVFYIFLRYIL